MIETNFCFNIIKFIGKNYTTRQQIAEINQKAPKSLSPCYYTFKSLNGEFIELTYNN